MSLARLVKEMKRWKTLSLKSVHFESAIQFSQLCGTSSRATSFSYSTCSENFSLLTSLIWYHCLIRFTHRTKILSTNWYYSYFHLRLIPTIVQFGRYGHTIASLTPFGQQHSCDGRRPKRPVGLGQLESMTLMGSKIIRFLDSHISILVRRWSLRSAGYGRLDSSFPWKVFPST